ncbi:MAG: 16S rRNA (cytosine(1402)-N(4))-methyltransferase RsmH [Deltaproteobacteria bacterium]|nr:16S rRNA (cytosine(1402)-N(4))-methyltransferase RsmH [Deltaproteobacteria bacterium]
MHEPVLVREVIEKVCMPHFRIFLDGTFGMGGHSRALLEHYPQLKIVALDRDLESLNLAKKRFKENLNQNLFLFHQNFHDFREIKSQLTFCEFDGALLDLGFSSYQISAPHRGFSFQHEGPLDMRMDQSQSLTADEVVNTYSQESLADIFKTYGEEPFSRKIAKLICETRQKARIPTTTALANLISMAAPRMGKSKIHPATRVFQALRIFVNNELSSLAQSLEDMVRSLNAGGRLGVIAFHSLEDRMVKQSFFKFENPCICPRNFVQCHCGEISLGCRVTKKPIVAGAAEIEHNPRSRSARLRIFERRKT